jgi:hypothetical protein
MIYDYVRSAVGSDKVLWAAEFQGGPVSTYLHLGRTLLQRMLEGGF